MSQLAEIRKVKQVSGDWTLVREYPKLAYAFSTVQDAVARVFPELASVQLFIGCPHQMKKHSHHQWKDTDKSGRNWRAFMHTGHFKNVICVHPHADRELKMRNLIGMMLHEFGHQINDLVGLPNTQKNADLVIFRYLGIGIKYEGPGRVQYADL
jgi:hypothetical protein